LPSCRTTQLETTINLRALSGSVFLSARGSIYVSVEGLRRTKGGREDILPLPDTTGRAIADYLRLERPPTTSRAVFVSHGAPCGRPIGPDCVGKTIRQAYARAGLPYTRAHLLRHTMASRLLASGSSLKQVADVLRHRSLNTTLVYAKLDTRSLSTVALPWPGDAK